MSQLYEFDGNNGLEQGEIAHLIIPGRYRSEDGLELHPFSENRAATAAHFFVEHSLESKNGVAVPSGYKNPADRDSTPWVDVASSIEYEGKPEAYGMRDTMIARGVPAKSIRPEIASVDTVTNFLNSRDLLPDARPIGIVAQEQHLERIMKVIAPKTLRQEYAGIVVPEIEGQIDEDGFMGALFSRIALLGLNPNVKPQDADKAEVRVNHLWGVVLMASNLKSSITSGKTDLAHSR